MFLPVNDNRIKKALLLVLTALFVIPSFARAQSMGFDMNQASQYLKHLPPVIKSTSFSPAEPQPGDPIKIIVKVDRFHFGGNDFESIQGVKLMYSVDDGVTWSETDMDEEENGKRYSAEVEAPQECGQLIYRFMADDTAGNIAIEIPPYLGLKDPPENAGENEISPFDRLNVLYEHPNAPDSEIPPYLDVLSVRFGYDDAKFYFRIEFEEPVRQGSITPLDANAYLFVLINRSLILDPALTRMLANGFRKAKPDDTDVAEVAKTLWAWYYAPLAEIAPPLPDIGKIPGVALIHIRPPDFRRPLFETKGFTYTLNGNYLDLSIDRAFIGPSERNTITFTTGNVRVVGADIMHAKPALGDIAYTSTVIMDDHAIDICKPQ